MLENCEFDWSCKIKLLVLQNNKIKKVVSIVSKSTTQELFRLSRKYYRISNSDLTYNAAFLVLGSVKATISHIIRLMLDLHTNSKRKKNAEKIP